MTHPGYTPIINLKRFRKCDRPQAVLLHLRRDHPAAELLRAICLEPGRVFSRPELVKLLRLGWNVGHANAALEFWILRINDSLPRTGWRIRDDYRIERISAEHENRLRLRLGEAA